MTEYREAIRILTENTGRTGCEEISLLEAYGRIIGEDMTAGENVPSFDRSPYDGYAFRAEDTDGVTADKPVTLRVIENIRAGQAASCMVTCGTAIRLMTGAPIPEGADAVCKYEDTDYTEAAVSLKREYRPGENIIRAGEDIKKGTLLIKAGSLIDAGMMGTMASLGVMKVKVCKRPFAGIISTGDELVDAASIPGPGMIRNSNRYTMDAALKGIGIDTVYLGHARDDTEETKRLIEKGKKCDIIISTGGVSVGDHDLVPDAMEEAGFEFLVRGVAIKPGMACAYGLKDGKLMLALSGNPASSLTNLQCICYPALKKLAGYREYDHKLIKMKLKDECKKAGKGTRFLRGRLDIIEGGAFLAAPLDQGNVVISSAMGCNAYGILTDMRAPLLSGSVIEGFLV